MFVPMFVPWRAKMTMDVSAVKAAFADAHRGASKDAAQVFTGSATNAIAKSKYGPQVTTKSFQTDDHSWELDVMVAGTGPGQGGVGVSTPVLTAPESGMGRTGTAPVVAGQVRVMPVRVVERTAQTSTAAVASVSVQNLFKLVQGTPTQQALEKFVSSFAHRLRDKFTPL